MLRGGGEYQKNVDALTTQHITMNDKTGILDRIVGASKAAFHERGLIFSGT